MKNKWLILQAIHTSVESSKSEGLSVTELSLSSGMGGLAVDIASSSSEYATLAGLGRGGVLCEVQL